MTKDVPQQLIRRNSWPAVICVLAWACLNTGCSVLYNNSKAWIESTTHSADEIYIFKDAWNWDEGFHYEFVGTNTSMVPLANNEPVHLIRMEAEGHYPMVYPVFPERMNPLKTVDAGAAVGGGLIGALAVSRYQNNGLAMAAGVLALVNTSGLFMKPRKAYDKSYRFDALLEMPRPVDKQQPIRVEGFHMRIPEGQHTWKYFQDMTRYQQDRVEFVSASDESVEIEYSNLDEDLNAILKELKFQPKMLDGMFHKDHAIQVSGELRSVHEHRVQGVVRYELETAWWVYNAYGIKTDTALVVNRSNWALYNFSNPGFDRDLISEALVHAMFEAMSAPEFEGKLNRIQNMEEEWTSTWNRISIPLHTLPAGKISAALESVVTIETMEGHGSGCVISEDGYIITNHHVVSDGNDEFVVHFQSGAQASAQLLRHHPVFDLALLKVDTTGLKPFAIRLSENIDVGEEAFAMGTPYDIDLGASVTKGIISGKRKDGERTLIQTDVSISPGNSGGALVLQDGTLIGIVNEKVLGMGVEGIGFAIPAHTMSQALWIDFEE